MITWVRKVIYNVYGKGAERRRAERFAAERAVEERAAEQRKVEEQARQTRLLEKRAAEERAVERRQELERFQQKWEAAEMAAWEAERQRVIKEEAAELRRWLNPFELGKKYENHKGIFTVVELSGNKMRIRWDSGEEITDTVESQARILHNMNRKQALLASFTDMVQCTRCRAWIYEDQAQYFNDMPYGYTCIQYVRGY